MTKVKIYTFLSIFVAALLLGSFYEIEAAMYLLAGAYVGTNMADIVIYLTGED